MTRFLRSALSAGALCLPVAVLAHPHGAAQAVIVQEQDLRWGEGPPALPPGSKAVVLEGDPSKPGPFTLRAKMPANYRIPPHYHPVDERITVLQGTAHIGMGERFDEAKMMVVPQGGYFSMPKGHRHYFRTSEETVIQLNGMGPWDIVYVNPSDDPRLHKGAAKKAPGSAP
jgi:hypothetical protein